MRGTELAWARPSRGDGGSPKGQEEMSDAL